MRSSGTPLRCLHVALVDSSDRAVAHAVTDSAGTFVIVAPSAGVYRVGVRDLRVGAARRPGGHAARRRAARARVSAHLRPRAAERQPRTGRRSPRGAAPPRERRLAQRERRRPPTWRSAIRSGWRSQRLSGDVVAQYVVDERGRACRRLVASALVHERRLPHRAPRPPAQRCATSPRASTAVRCASWYATASHSTGGAPLPLVTLFN